MISTAAPARVGDTAGPAEIEHATLSAAPFEESEPHSARKRLDSQAQHGHRGLARGGARTKEHSEGAAALGSELQTADIP